MPAGCTTVPDPGVADGAAGCAAAGGGTAGAAAALAGTPTGPAGCKGGTFGTPPPEAADDNEFAADAGEVLPVNDDNGFPFSTP